MIDVQDLDAPFLTTSFTNEKCAIDHNMMVRGPRLFQANYTTGLRIYNVSDINAVTEVGYFDTHPESSATSFDGAWGVYTGFPSGIVLVSDIQRGLFVLDVTGTGSGACCDTAAWTCTDGVLAENCNAATQVWTTNEICANITCNDPLVPAASEWGLAVFTLALLTVGTLVLRRRKTLTA